MVGVGTAVAVGTGLGDTLVGVGTTVGSTVGSRVSAGIGVSVGVGSGVFNEPRTLPSGDGVYHLTDADGPCASCGLSGQAVTATEDSYQSHQDGKKSD